MNNKEFLDFIKEKLNVEASSHLSGLSDEDAAKIEKHFGAQNKKSEAKPKESPVEKKKEVPKKEVKKDVKAKPTLDESLVVIDDEPTVVPSAVPFENTEVQTFIKFKDGKTASGKGHHKKDAEAQKSEKTMKEKM